MAAPHVTGVAALFLGAGKTYSRARDLYADIVAHATPNVIGGLKSSDTDTPKALLYNKLEDISESYQITPQDGVQVVEAGNQKNIDIESSKKKKKKNIDSELSKKKKKKGKGH